MHAIDILMPVPMHAFVIKGVEGRYRLHKLWQADNPQTLIGEVANNVQFILSSGGSVKIDGPFMSQFPQLKAIINFGVGYDAVDATWAAQHGIIVTNTPDVLNDEVADLAMGLALATIRQIPQADRFLRDGKWEAKTFPLSASLKGRTMGILGLGRIGKAIACRAAAFNLKIIYHGRHEQAGIAYPYYADLKAMAGACDILMLVAPGTAETRHIVDRAILEALGPQGVLINVGRGSLVDEEALIEALESGTILSAGLDVFEHEPQVPERLRALPQVVLLPHIASASAATRQAMGQLVIDNLDALAEGKAPLTPVKETSNDTA